MPTTYGTSKNDPFTLITYYNGTLDGLAGTDSLSIGTLQRNQFTLTQKTDSSILLDTVSGASGQPASHMVLVSIENLYYNSSRNSIDLTQYFPTITDVSPANGSTAISTSTPITVTFNETIHRGSGNISLHQDSASGSVLESFNAATSQLLNFQGSTLTISPGTLQPNTHYYLSFDSGSVIDTNNNPYLVTQNFDFTTQQNLILNGSNSVHDLSGGTGNDVFTPGSGGDTVNGLGGIDTVQYSLARQNYNISQTTSGWTVQDTTGKTGTDILSNIERLSFADSKLALDLSGNAGTTAKILGAVFGKASVTNQQYVGIGLQYLDSGTAYQDLMQKALETKLGTDINDASKVVDLLYNNVVGSAPDQATLATYVGLLNSHQYTAASLGVLAADTSFNTANIDLIGLSHTGIAFI